MTDDRKFTAMIFEGLCYGLIGTVFVVLAIAVTEFLAKMISRNSFSNDDFGRETLAVLWIFLGVSGSAILINLLFKNSGKNFFIKWVLILSSSSILTVFLQKIFQIYYQNQRVEKLFDLLEFEHERIGLWWEIRLFLILAPFTLLFANRRYIIEKIKASNSLK